MAKTYLSTVKYEVKAKYEITGLVEKPDIVGAIFGQSEGLLGEDMDLKQLQQNGKIGRIEITVNKGKGTTTGEIIIPSSLDQVKTSILAATMETVEKVGPCEAKVNIVSISDVRQEKRGQITDRAKELLKKMQKFEGVESDVLVEDIRSEMRTEKAVTYKGMAAGPDVEKSKSIIVVEGRADVLKLLSYGINDAIEMNGSNISKELIDICKEKEVTMLVDGDRGGELNAKKLNSLTKVDYVARAPDGKEVEELAQKEILQALKRRLNIKEFIDGKTGYQGNNNHREERNGRYDRNTRNDSYNDRRNNFPRTNNYPNRTEGNNYNRNDTRPSYNQNSPRPSYERRDGNSFNRNDNYQDRRNNYPRTNNYPDRRETNNYPNRNDTRPSYSPQGSDNFSRPDTRPRYENHSTDNQKSPSDSDRKPIAAVIDAPKEILALKKDFEKMKGKLKARLYDAKKKKIKDVDVKEMIEAIEKSKKKVDTVLFDGIITKRLLDVSEAKGVKNIIGVRKSSASSDKVSTYTM